MASVNVVFVLGNLCADPELRHIASGQAVCDLRIATNEGFTDKAGNKKEATEYHSVVTWGKTAENCAKYLHRGSSAFVQGRLQTRSWEKDGVKHYKTEIIASTVQFLGGKSEAQGAPASPPTDDGDTIPF